MSSRAYLEAAAAGLARLRETQQEAIDRGAGMVAEAITEGHKVLSFGATHSFIVTMEMVYRTGGLMLVNPIYPHGMDLSVRPMTLTSQLERVEGLGRVLLEQSPAERGDVLVIASVSGRNHVAIDMALAAREGGVATIAVTSMEYSQAVESRHPSGRKLYEVCDHVIDNCAPEGDAAVAIPGLEQRTGPLSTVLGCAVVNAMVAEAIRRLVEQGVTPPVFVSANLPGGDEHNARLLAENRGRIFYLE